MTKTLAGATKSAQWQTPRDGYQIAPNDAAVFHSVPAPTDADVAIVVERVYRKVARKLDARSDDDRARFASSEPVMSRSRYGLT